MDRRHRTDFDPPGASGPLVWYLVKSQAMEIRMTDNLLDDCFAAARTLDARFFVMRRPLGIGLPDGWGVFDTQNPYPNTPYQKLALQGGKYARPVKVFDTETIDAPIMWAIAIGGTR